MDLNLLTRLQSHSRDLFKLDARLHPIREGDSAAENESIKPVKLPVVPLVDDNRRIPPSTHEEKGYELEDESKPSGTKHYEDLWGAITRNIGKGFVIGYFGKVGVNSLYPLLDFLRRRKTTIDRKAIVFNAPEYGLFFGTLLGVYNGVMFESRKYTNVSWLVERYRGFIAGFLSGSALIWVPYEKRWPVILFTFVRMVELQARLMVRRRLLPSCAHGDTLLMVLASASMIHSFTITPQSLDKSYVNFLYKFGNSPAAVVEALAQAQLGKPLNLAKLNPVRAKVGKERGVAVDMLTDPLGYDSWAPGELLHPGMSLGRYLAQFFARNIKLAIGVYIPVFTVPVLLFYPSQLVRNPVKTIRRVGWGVSQSSLFLTVYCCVGMSALSLLRSVGFKYNIMGAKSQVAFAIAGGLGALATLLEKKSRRIELALYVLSKAVEARWNQLIMSKKFTPWKGGGILVFMYCFGIICHTYNIHPGMLRATYLSLLKRFLDSTEARHKFYSMPKFSSRSFPSFRQFSQPGESEEN